MQKKRELNTHASKKTTNAIATASAQIAKAKTREARRARDLSGETDTNSGDGSSDVSSEE